MTPNIKDNTESLFEAKLLRSEDKFWTLFNLSPVGMAIVDAKTGDFLNVNSSVLKSTGYTEEEFIHLSYWDITPKEYEEQELQQIEDLKKQVASVQTKKNTFEKMEQGSP